MFGLFRGLSREEKSPVLLGLEGCMKRVIRNIRDDMGTVLNNDLDSLEAKDPSTCSLVVANPLTCSLVSAYLLGVGAVAYALDYVLEYGFRIHERAWDRLCDRYVEAPRRALYAKIREDVDRFLKKIREDPSILTEEYNGTSA
jgi:hypothetical protein